MAWCEKIQFAHTTVERSTQHNTYKCVALGPQPCDFSECGSKKSACLSLCIHDISSTSIIIIIIMGHETNVWHMLTWPLYTLNNISMCKTWTRNLDSKQKFGPFVGFASHGKFYVAVLWFWSFNCLELVSIKLEFLMSDSEFNTIRVLVNSNFASYIM